MATTLTTSTTVCFYRDPTTTFEAESEWQLPSLPQLPSVFRETPPPPWKQNLTVVGVVGFNYPHYPNYRVFLERPHPHP